MAYHVVSKTAASGPYNKRRGMCPVPNNLVEFLTHHQMVSLRQMEYFGWRLSFIRRTGENEATAIVSNGKRFAKLENDGTLNSELEIHFRM